jgi:hypothetical protein
MARGGNSRAGVESPVAWALQNRPAMTTDSRTWRRLTAEAIAELPETAAVFEVGNLVRTVQFIGKASGNLRARIAAYAQEDLKWRPIPGGYYFRYEPAAPAREDETLDSRLAAYRNAHGGQVPGGNAEMLPALRVASSRRAA